MAPSEELVLLTGGSGYLGSWTIVRLLQAGYRVRTTVRSLAKESGVRAMISQQVEDDGKLEFVTADLLKDEGWDQAVTGCTYVMHTASPMPVGEFKGQDLVTPAQDGARRVVEAAINAGVRRVVMTSSAEAAKPLNRNGVIEESVWPVYPADKAFEYARSKVLAERMAWDLIARADGRTQLATVLPAFIQGPVLGPDFSGSVDVVAKMLRGQVAAIPRIGLSIVDIRDLVDLHLLAMTEANAAGERFLGGGEFLWLEDIARILRESLGDAAAKVPTHKLPNLVVRIGGLLNADLAQLRPGLGVRRNLDASKADRLMGWRTRPAAESIVDGARSLLERGLV